MTERRAIRLPREQNDLIRVARELGLGEERKARGAGGRKHTAIFFSERELSIATEELCRRLAKPDPQTDLFSKRRTDESLGRRASKAEQKAALAAAQLIADGWDPERARLRGRAMYGLETSPHECEPEMSEAWRNHQRLAIATGRRGE